MRRCGLVQALRTVGRTRFARRVEHVTMPKGFCAAMQCYPSAEIPRINELTFQSHLQTFRAGRSRVIPSMSMHCTYRASGSTACVPRDHVQIMPVLQRIANTMRSATSTRTSAAADWQVTGSTSLGSAHSHSPILCMRLLCHRIALHTVAPSACAMIHVNGVREFKCWHASLMAATTYHKQGSAAGRLESTSALALGCWLCPAHTGNNMAR